MGFQKIKSFWSVSNRDERIESSINNVELLIDYAKDTKKKLDMAEKAQAFITLISAKSVKELIKEEIEQLSAFEHQLLPEPKAAGESEVTLDSLRATGGATGGKHFWSSVGIYLIFLWIFLFGSIGLSFYLNYQLQLIQINIDPGDDLSDKQQLLSYLADYFIPFIYGALGACAYLMRVTGKRLRDRTFSPNRFPEHFNRIFLGAVSGGVIVILLQDAFVIGNPDEGVPISAAALGFIAGYSIEFLYQVIDRIIAAIIPNINVNMISDKHHKKKVEFLLNEYQKTLEKLKLDPDSNKEKIIVIEKIIRDLKDDL